MFLVLTTLESYAARAGRTQRPFWAAVIADALADLVGIARRWLAYRLVRDRQVPRWLRRRGAA